WLLAVGCYWQHAARGAVRRWCNAPPPREEGPMDLYAILDQVIDLLRQRQRVTYRALQVHFQLEDETLAALTDELLYTHPEVHDEAGRGLTGRGGLDTPPAPPPPAAPAGRPPASQDLLPALSTTTLAAPADAERRQLTV